MNTPTDTTPALAALRVKASHFETAASRKPIAVDLPLAELLGLPHTTVELTAKVCHLAPVRYPEDKRRGKRNVRTVVALLLHLKSLPGGPFKALLQRLEERGLAFAAWTGFHHLANSNADGELLLWLPLSRSLNPGEHEALHQHLVADLELERLAVDPDVSAVWPVACCPVERRDKAWHRIHDGAPLNVNAALLEAEIRQHIDGNGALREDAREDGLLTLVGIHHRFGLDADAMLPALMAFNAARCEPPFTEAEVRVIAERDPTADENSPLVTAHCTDVGNAERIEAFAEGKLLYCPPLKAWLYFNGICWCVDDSGHAVRLYCAMVRRTLALAWGVEDTDQRQQLVAHAFASESNSRVKAGLELAQSRLHAPHESFDTHPFALACANGTLDLRSGELRPARPSDRITLATPVAYDPDATCPRFEQFLDEITNHSAEMVAFLQRAVGYSISGTTREQVVFIGVGSGANGKSVFLSAVREAFGDYAKQASTETFMDRDSDTVRNDIARLAGARLVVASETKEGQALSESLIKVMTGGEPLVARFLFKELFEFTPAFTVWLSTNHLPRIRGADHGIWRRLRVIPFPVTFTPAQQDKDLPEKLRAELPGILAWAARGCLRWQQEGLGVPDEVGDATQYFKRSSDPLSGFIDDRCVLGPDEVATAADLYDAYLAWCIANDNEAQSKRWLGLQLNRRGFTAARNRALGRHWVGLRLRADDEPSPADPVDSTPSDPVDSTPGDPAEVAPEGRDACRLMTQLPGTSNIGDRVPKIRAGVRVCESTPNMRHQASCVTLEDDWEEGVLG